jgi:hypothetical protein
MPTNDTVKAQLKKKALRKKIIAGKATAAEYDIYEGLVKKLGGKIGELKKKKKKVGKVDTDKMTNGYVSTNRKKTSTSKSNLKSKSSDPRVETVARPVYEGMQKKKFKKELQTEYKKKVKDILRASRRRTTKSY